MLVDIDIDKSKIDKEISFFEEKLNEEEFKNDEKISKVIESIVSKLKKIKSINNLVERKDLGIYEGYLESSKIRDYCNVENFDPYYAFDYMYKYPNDYDKWDKQKKQWGTSDTIEQILNHYPELHESDRKFFIVYHEVHREHQSPTGGFRYEKNGDYIGIKNPTHEYLYDDKHIDFVLLYHIYEVL